MRALLRAFLLSATVQAAVLQKQSKQSDTTQLLLPQVDLSVGSDGKRGAVASESMLCTEIGIGLMKKGGNAADALVGTQLCVGVASMYHSGIGGGGFMLVRDAQGNVETIDYRETAPAAAYQDMYEGNVNGSFFGGLAAGVPGELRGLEALHSKHGRLPWKDVVMPSVKVARDGFRVNEDLLRYMTASEQFELTHLVTDPNWAKDFAPNGKLLGLGELLTRKRHADTLEEIANKGADAFYEGPIAQSIINHVQATNGTMTLDDLKSYSVITRPPLSIDFRGHKVYSIASPGGGAVALSLLKTMEQYSTDDLVHVNLTTHRLIEAMRFAYGARMNLGDPAFVPEALHVERKITSDKWAKQVQAHILDNQTQPVEAYLSDGHFLPNDHGTSHIVVTDASGLTISSTTTINTLFGAAIMTPDTGIILNNEMNDFSIPGRRNAFGYEPSVANYIRPGKRPMSSCSPMIAFRPSTTTIGTDPPSLYFVTGAAGGSRIISATAMAAWHILELGFSMAEALTVPRLHDQLMPNEIEFERTFNKVILESLRERGHQTREATLAFSSMQGIRLLENGRFEAASEPRQKNSGSVSF